MRADQVDQTRRRLALLLNAVAPGAGLVMLRREWLGLAVAGLFTVLTQVMIWGLWITPAKIPFGLAVTAGLIGALIWIGAQWLAWIRAGRILGERARHELTLMRRRIDEAVAHERYEEAHALARIALSLNDEDPELHVRMARLLSRFGRLPEARRYWRTILKLKASPNLCDEARKALGGGCGRVSAD